MAAPARHPSSPRRSLRYAGFTLVEMTVTILILGILAVVVLPRFVDRRDYDTLKFYDQALSAVRYAQKVAIAQRSQVFVVADPGALSVCFDAGCASPVMDPSTGAALVLPAPGGVTLSMAPASFAFTGLGGPSGAATPVVLTVSGTPVRSFSIEADTGYVHP